MAFFNSGAFWFIEGIFAVLAIVALNIWAKDKNIPMPLWKWAIVIAWVLFVAINVAFVGTSIGEGENNAALMAATFASAIMAVSGVIVWRLLKVR